MLLLVIAGCSLFGKKKELKPFISEVVHPEWSKNSVLYEVNVRQYTRRNIQCICRSIFRGLESLGVDVLWFMPIFPIGVQNRKGELGSYYSVKDYMDVNPEFGTLRISKELLKRLMSLECMLLLDWVPNHTSWDNKLTIDHPDWYVKDSTGKFTPPIGY